MYENYEMSPTVRYLTDSNGSSVAYASFGSGPLLVCPCWWISHVEKDWDSPPFTHFFSALGKAFRVTLYDRPGVGLSDRDVPPRTLDLEVELLGQVIDAVADAGEKVSLLAISCGAPVALAYAARHGNRLDRICCYGGFLDGADIAAPEVQKVMLETVRTHWGLGSRTLADLFLPDQSREELDWLSRQQRHTASAEKAAELLALTYEMDATDAIAELSTELFVIHRNGDRAIPCAAGRRLAAAVPGTPFRTFTGSAHPPWFGEPDVLTVIVNYLSGSADSTDAQSSGDAVTVPHDWSLDAPNRAARTPDGPIPLTPLEFGVAQRLVDATGRVVTRDELLEHVWHSPFEGSNKVDAVIRTLRKKLGPRAKSIETVRGHGFRLRQS